MTLGRSGWGRLLAFSHSSPRRKSARLSGTKPGGLTSPNQSATRLKEEAIMEMKGKWA